VTVSRGTVARLHRSLAAVLASRPPLCVVLDARDGEPDDAWRARRAEAERQAEAVRAVGRRAFVIIVDLDEGER
jgi:hypothetical protein